MTGKRILLVDDDPDIRAIVTMSLERIGGFSVLAVEGGTEALAAVGAREFDAVLMDLTMPGMDGRELLVRLRKEPRTLALPVVFLTARAGRTENEALRSLGAAGVLVKPFDPLTLPEELARLLAWT